MSSSLSGSLSRISRVSIPKALNIFSAVTEPIPFICPEERYAIWQDIINRIFEEKENFIEPETPLDMINTIITSSEKYGTANIVSHNCEKIMKIPLKINILMRQIKNLDLEISKDIYTTSTIYDLKKIIQQKTSIDQIYLKIIKPNTQEIAGNNGDTLYSFLNLKYFEKSKSDLYINNIMIKEHSILVELSNDFYTMNKYKLIDDSNPEVFDNKLINILKNIFDTSTNHTGKMTRKLFSDFLNKMFPYFFGGYYEKQLEKYNVLDKDKKGYLTLDEFIKFYWD